MPLQFDGSHEGAYRVAMMYSFFTICKIKEIKPFEWLENVLERIGDRPESWVE